MAYHKPAEDIYNEMFLGYTTTSTGNGSLIYNSNMPVCMQLSQAYLNLDESIKKVYARTAVESGYSDYVDLKAEEVGLTRKNATFAEIEITVNGAPNAVWNSGSIVGTKDNRLYATETDLVLDTNGIGAVKVKAEKIGTQYNVNADEINYLPIKYSGIFSITNKAAYNGAVDKETNEALYERFLIKVRTPATSGNIYHYLNWALEVDGVGKAKVDPLWNGNGTVKVVIANSNKRAATPELIQSTKNHIDPYPEGKGNGQAPIGATVTVVSAIEKAIDVTGNVKIATGFTIAQIQAEFTQLFTKYLESVAFNTTYISINQIGNILFNTAGVIDHANLKINNISSNIALADEEIAVCGTATLGVIT